MGFLSNDADSWGGGAEMLHLEMMPLRRSWALCSLLSVLGEAAWEGSTPDCCSGLVLPLHAAPVVSTAILELAVVEKIEPRAWCVTATC